MNAIGNKMVILLTMKVISCTLSKEIFEDKIGTSNCLDSSTHKLGNICTYYRMTFRRRANPQMLLVR